MVYIGAGLCKASWQHCSNLKFAHPAQHCGGVCGGVQMARGESTDGNKITGRSPGAAISVSQLKSFLLVSPWAPQREQVQSVEQPDKLQGTCRYFSISLKPVLSICHVWKSFPGDRHSGLDDKILQFRGHISTFCSLNSVKA